MEARARGNREGVESGAGTVEDAESAENEGSAEDTAAGAMTVTRRARRWGGDRESGPETAAGVGEEHGGFVTFEDQVVTEYPLTILLDGRELATIVCSPTHLEELVLGFLVAEGILRRREPVEDLYVIPEEGIAVVRTAGPAEPPESALLGKRWVGSCCGKSRAGFYFANDARTARPVEGDLRLSPEDCAGLMGELQAASPVFEATGGVHNAGLATRRSVDVVRTDIGRHNTLDKLYGHALREGGIRLAERAVVFSGRVSSEVLLKVVKMGCPILLSKSAPTDLALDLAEDLGVTTVGFLRGDSMNVYTRPERIARGWTE